MRASAFPSCFQRRFHSAGRFASMVLTSNKFSATWMPGVAPSVTAIKRYANPASTGFSASNPS